MTTSRRTPSQHGGDGARLPSGRHVFLVVGADARIHVGSTSLEFTLPVCDCNRCKPDGLDSQRQQEQSEAATTGTRPVFFDSTQLERTAICVICLHRALPLPWTARVLVQSQKWLLSGAIDKRRVGAI